MQKPRFLVIETSGRVGHVALGEGESIIDSRRLEETRRHARDLAPAVRDMLIACSWRPKEINAVIVSRGPGSYTGLRVGIMSAKTFAYATGCALLAIDTFAAIALQAPLEVQVLDVVEDAQQDKIYVQRFGRTKDGMTPVSQLAIQAFDAWLGDVPADVWLSGPGLHGREASLMDRKVVAPEHRHPAPASLLHIGLARFSRGEVDDLWNVEPLYLRPSAAEEKWKELGRA